MLNGYKTYLAALAALLTALGAAIHQYVVGGVINYEAVILAAVALALLFLRQSIKQNGVK